jgi:hypothetical protein
MDSWRSFSDEDISSAAESSRAYALRREQQMRNDRTTGWRD